jgi:hypothetical protein
MRHSQIIALVYILINLCTKNSFLTPDGSISSCGCNTPLEEQATCSGARCWPKYVDLKIKIRVACPIARSKVPK